MKYNLNFFIISSFFLFFGCTANSQNSPQSNLQTSSNSAVSDLQSDCKSNDKTIVSLRITKIPPKCSIQRPFTKYFNIFGINVFATKSISNKKMIHAGNILAQYMDNDEDGKPDDSNVLKAMTNERASLVMATEDEFEIFMESDLPEDIIFQDLLKDETRPEYHQDRQVGFDASLEEVLHLVQATGWAIAYPEVFGTEPGSKLAQAMDQARGGFFEEFPDKYPSNAWYAYNDETCDYGCQVIEYSYWVTTTYLGAQDYPGRNDEIGDEWQLTKKSDLINKDSGWKVIASKQYHQPVNKLPDGKYLGPASR